MVPEARQPIRGPRTAALQLWLAAAARRHFDAATLTAADRRRWQRMISAAHRAEWMTSRALLAAIAPPAWKVWSLSHAGGSAALVSASDGMRIGVDLERVKKRDVTRLASFGFDPRELAALSRLPARERLRDFYTLWTLKEAAAKALGIGIWRALRECVFVRDAAGWAARLPTARAWRAWIYEPRPGMVLTVVCIGGLTLLRAPRHREWPGDVRRAGRWKLVGRLTAPGGGNARKMALVRVAGAKRQS